MFCVTNRVHGSQGFGKLSPQHFREPPVNSQGPGEFLLMIGWENVSGFERKGVYVTGQNKIQVRIFLSPSRNYS